MKPPTVDPLRASLYESYVDNLYGWQNDLSPEGFEKRVRSQARSFGPLLPAEREARILELGCGDGALLVGTRRLGYQSIEGVDASPQQVELCRRAGLEVACDGAAEFLRATDREFDAIVMSDVLEHMSKEYALEVLRLVHRRLSPGGRVVIRVPNMSNPLNLRTRYADLTHGIGFTVESLRQALLATGFAVDTVRGEYFVHPRWWVRWVFDGLLWKAFQVFVRRTLHLPAPIERGKNLLAVGRKASAGSAPPASARES